MTIATVTSKQIQYPWNPANAAALKVLADALVAAGNLGTLAGGALTANEGGRAVMANDYLDLATIARVVDAKAIDTGSIADAAITATQIENDAVTTAKILDANVTTAKIATNALAASSGGRALMQTGFFTEAKATDAFAAQAITAALIKNADITATQLASDAITTVKITDANVTVAKLAGNLRGAPQALSGAGAINLTTRTTLYTSTGVGNALTIADSTETGQRKTVIHVVDGGSGVITAGASLHLGHSIATITFTTVRDWVELEWGGAAWNVVAFGGVTFT
jgi:hypothetical protein